jgi:hypothetical protein
VRDEIEEIFFYLRRTIDMETYQAIKDEFLPPKFFKEILSIGIISSESEQNQLDILFKKKFLLIEKFYKNSVRYPSLKQKLLDLKNVILQEENKTGTIKNALKKALISEFYLQLTPKSKSSIVESSVSLFEGENQVLGFKLQEDGIFDLMFEEDIFFSDTTFVESPMYLQLSEVINSATTLLEIAEDENKRRIYPTEVVSLHIKDLITKLKEAQYARQVQASLFDVPLFDVPFDIHAKNISEIIHGFFHFDREDRDFYFSDNQNVKHKVTNVASGIKSFGIIQLLIQANILNERSLLIIDEPETHLHPEWQVKYAELLVQLAKSGIPILLTSHSPYIIQGLRYYSERELEPEKVTYYLAEYQAEENCAEIVNVTDDLNRIFSKLSEPLQHLVWNQ